MFKNKSYIGISFIILVFGIWAVPKIIDRFQNDQIVKGDRLDKVSNSNTNSESLEKIGPAPKFELVNQDNIKITNEAYKGKVYVLEFFFSTCPTICPKMNQSMLQIEKTFFGNPNFGIVSITIDPEHDTAKVLKEHRELLGVKSSNWNFLTGDKTYIFDLSNKGFNLYAGENNKPKAVLNIEVCSLWLIKTETFVAEKTNTEIRFYIMMVLKKLEWETFNKILQFY